MVKAVEALHRCVGKAFDESESNKRAPEVVIHCLLHQ